MGIQHFSNHMSVYLLTINIHHNPTLTSCRLYQPQIQTKQFLRLYLSTKTETLKRFTKWKIKFINNFAIQSKFHLKNWVYIFGSVYKCFELFHQILNKFFFTPSRKTISNYSVWVKEPNRLYSPSTYLSTDLITVNQESTPIKSTYLSTDLITINQESTPI